MRLSSFRYCLGCVHRHYRFPSWREANHFMLYTAQGVTGFSAPTARERRHEGDRNALW
jgi:hypothetical protein